MLNKTDIYVHCVSGVDTKSGDTTALQRHIHTHTHTHKCRWQYV